MEVFVIRADAEEELDLIERVSVSVLGVILEELDSELLLRDLDLIEPDSFIICTYFEKL